MIFEIAEKRLHPDEVTIVSHQLFGTVIHKDDLFKPVSFPLQFLEVLYPKLFACVWVKSLGTVLPRPDEG